MFANAGITKAPETFDEFLDAIKKLKDSGVTPLATGAKDAWRLVHLINGLYAKRVGVERAYGLGTGETKFTDDDVVDVYRILVQLVDAGAFDKNMAGLDYAMEKTNFFAEKAAMVYDGTWFIGEIEQTPIKDKVRTFLMPTMSSAPHLHDNDVLYCGGFALSNLVKDENEKEAMIKVAKYLSSADASERFAVNGKRAPVRTDVNIGSESLGSIFADVIEQQKHINFGIGDVAAYTYKATMGDLFGVTSQALVLKEKTPEEVAKMLQDEMDKQ